MLEEGVNDPAIFKAVFLAGGPGSGKSFIVGQTALTSLGLKLVNSDNAFELALKKAGMDATPDSIFSDKGQALRHRSKVVTNRRQDRYIEGRLGLVIDGTGKDYAKIEKQKKALETLGYETMMILVNTDEPTAQARNKMRDRTLPDSQVKTMWSQVQNNIGKFQNLFGQNFIIVDNSEDSDYKGGVMSAYRKMMRWTKTPPANYRAKKWMNAEKKARGMKEEKEFKPHYMFKGNQKVMAKKPEDHERLKKKGYTHDDPTTKKVEEVMDPDASIGDFVRDFKKSDSPQFRGKSKSKRRQMAVAAYLAKKRKREDIGEAKFGKRYPNCVKEDDVQEAPQWAQKSLSKTVYKMQYKKALPILQQLLDRKKKEGGGKLKHGIEYYAHSIARQISPNVDPRTLAKMAEEYNPDIHQWGTDVGTDHMLSLTPGETPKKKKKVKEHCGCEEDEYILTSTDMTELESEAESMSFEDMIDYGMYDIDDFEMDEDDPHSDVQITEALSVQGRLKRRFNARKNKQKLKISRNLAMRRASSPDRLKKRANRGARGMIYKRLLRGRSRAKLPPSERARFEKMIDTRFSGLISRLSTRMLPNMRKAEIARLKKRRGSKPKTSKKYKAAKPKVAKSQKAKKFKVKK